MVNLTVACCHTSLPQRKKKKEKKEEMKSRRKKKMKHDTVPMLWKICGPLLMKGVNMTIGNILCVNLHACKHALELRSRALARATSCFCPADRGAPPSARVISSPRGFDSTTLAK